MLDLDANPVLRLLFRIARLRVTLGFAVAAVAFTLARPSWTSIAAGVPIAMVGEGVRLWAAGHLEKAREVTISGPYRFTRHPLYAGSALIGVGFSVAAASTLVAAVVLGYLAVMVSVAIRLEEATLRAAFGEMHAHYVAGDLAPTTRRFSMRRARGNREHQAVIGLLASVVILAAKAWLAALP